MKNLFKRIRSHVLGAPSEKEGAQDERQAKYLISLGVLLWIVAEADEEFLPEEQEKIEEVLKLYGEINDQDMPIVLRAIQEANVMRIDVHEFTRDIKKDLEREDKIDIIEHLFRVACADKELDTTEHEMIRKIADLFGLDHKEFIDSKIKVKKELGMDTVDS